MVRTIADAIRYVGIEPDQLGLSTLEEKIRQEEQIVAVVSHAKGTKTVIENG